MPKGAGLFSLKGMSCHVLWRKLAADWRATIVQFYLHVQYGFMVALHDPLPVPHYHPSSATLWLHQCFLCRCPLFTCFGKHALQAESFPYVSTLVRLVLSCLGCDMSDVGHRWVQPILPYLGNSISQIASPIVHCQCNNSGALMLLHP